ncbi:phosphoribosylaminoimidazolesuccinocarboxamide synthase [Candidatus Gromoviella agglomerans]|uniref:phosphoribosylaminoimidazolesuccinocarboxamide synthase n=1 Tax=Candidatus Gromoviella agglomerans TaxID=2806609 RepID=UPI001E4381B1|nr:phosphoribosylaminoimidazolesuccinocarboxamide synthase [Candidatus Gromoviella agglomerans]UFX98452.1 Phosphoribosylaminoimidazole-succinocarboxamide synthase [Candidatus Gromoviella agglomerans]
MIMKNNWLNKIYEGRDKILFHGPERNTLVQRFKDEVLINGKPFSVNGRGCFNNRISQYFMSKLNLIGIKTHSIRIINIKEQLIRSLEMFPFRIVIRNSPSNEMFEKFAISEFIVFDDPIMEFYFNNSDKIDDMVNNDHILAFSWATKDDLECMESISLRVNDFFQGFFSAMNMKLHDISFEFGKYEDDFGESSIILGDSITLDSMNLSDLQREIDFSKKNDVKELLSIYRSFIDRIGITKFKQEVRNNQ